MSDDLAPTIALGIGSALLAFECFAALISLLQVRGASRRRPPSSAAQLQTTPALSFTPRVAVRAHFTAQRDLINAMRRQYPTLRSTRHGQELRGAIRRLPRHPIAENHDRSPAPWALVPGELRRLSGGTPGSRHPRGMPA